MWVIARALPGVYEFFIHTAYVRRQHRGMKHDHTRLSAWKNDTGVRLHGVQAAEICPFGKDDERMNPGAFCSSEMCIQLERLLEKVTNGKSFC